MKKNILSAQDICSIAIGTAIITICSWISIPGTVPFTLQNFAIILISLVFGRKRALLSLLIYFLLGFTGMPVFAGFKSGVSMLVGPTGGFAIGLFILPLTTELFQKKNTILTFISITAGTLLLYILGALWYFLIYTNGEAEIIPLLSVCVFPFIIPDAVKCILAIFAAQKIKKGLLLS